MSEDKFEWNDTLVGEVVKYCLDDSAGILTPFGIEKNIYDFIKSKTQQHKDYEIVEFKHKSQTYILRLGVYTRTYSEWEAKLNHIPANAEINSVRRISDGEVFSVGDSICLSWYPAFNVRQPIVKIELVGGKIMLYYDNGSYELANARINPKHEVKQPLFTTEDGVQIFEGDRFWYIDNRMTPFECLSAPQGSIFICTFSTKEKADEYILLNQKLLSVNDICEWYKQYYYVGMPELQSAFIESIKRIAKGKM